MFSEKLRNFAIERYGSLTKLAEALGMQLTSLHRYSSGKTEPGMKFLQKLQALGCDIDWLLDNESAPVPRKSYEDATAFLEDTIGLNKKEFKKLFDTDQRTFYYIMKVLSQSSDLIDENNKLKKQLDELREKKEEG